MSENTNLITAGLNAPICDMCERLSNVTIVDGISRYEHEYCDVHWDKYGRYAWWW